MGRLGPTPKESDAPLSNNFKGGRGEAHPERATAEPGPEQPASQRNQVLLAAHPLDDSHIEGREELNDGAQAAADLTRVRDESVKAVPRLDTGRPQRRRALFPLLWPERALRAISTKATRTTISNPMAIDPHELPLIVAVLWSPPHV